MHSATSHVFSKEALARTMEVEAGMLLPIAGVFQPLPTRQRRARKIELKARCAHLNKRCADEPESFVPERRTLMKPEASHKEVVLVSDAAQRKP